MLAAAENAHWTSSNVVLLTQLGGGAFGNDPDWILAAMRRALGIARGWSLDVRLVCHQAIDPLTQTLVNEFS